MTKNLKKIFETLKIELLKYSPPFSLKSDFGSRLELTSYKDVVIAGRKKDEIYFAGLIIQNKYVSFYYMVVYVDPESKKTLGQELAKTLKGKSCFHINYLDKTLLSQIKKLLAAGKVYYKSRAGCNFKSNRWPTVCNGF